MITHVLLIDSDSGAMTRIKDALEKAGNFEASVFTTGLAALEHAEKNPPSLAVVSLNVQDVPPDELVTGLRGLYATIPVLLRAPDEADPQLIDQLKPQGVLYGNYTTRVLIPMIEEALAAALTAPEPAQAGPGSTTESGDSLLTGAHAGDDLAEFGEVLKAIEPGLQTEEQDTFKALVESLRTRSTSPPCSNAASPSRAGPNPRPRPRRPARITCSRNWPRRNRPSPRWRIRARYAT
jgi:DNA-binding NarL/FixJ family response regulator